MSFKKLVFLIAFLGIFAGGFFVNSQPVQAATAEELIALIAQLKAQILQLQQQLATTQGQPAAWCHNFNTNLRIEDAGSEVVALQTALAKEGATTWEYKGYDGVFDETTASEVVGFQEKYKKDILSPFGLTRGTGFVGKGTRAKLNALYGCGMTTPPIVITTPPVTATPSSITVLSPNGGKNLLIGETYSISWNSQEVERVFVSVCETTDLGEKCYGLLGTNFVGIDASKGQFSWKVESAPYAPSNNLKIKIKDAVSDVFDMSDGYFSISLTSTKADLVPLSITNPESILLGDTVVFSSGVENRGGTLATGFSAKWFVDDKQVLYGSILDVPAYSTSTTGSNVKYTWTATAGTHTVKFTVDPDDVVRESDETNNTIAKVIVVEAKSITVTSPNMVYPADGQVLNYGYPHGYMFKVKPISGASSYRFQFYQGGALIFNNLDHIENLSLNGEFALWSDDKSYPLFKEGDVTVVIQALIGNQWTDARTISITLGRSDLYPTPITTPNVMGAIKAGDQVFFDSGIGNKGPVTTGTFNIKWFVDDAQTGYGSHSGVSGNSTVMEGNSQFIWTAIEGTHAIKFVVDVDNHVTESDETNNTAFITLTVLSVLTPPPSSGGSGGGGGIPVPLP